MFKTETKQCQNCKTDFTIEPEDFEFYKKIDVPAPTFCPECRMVRRMALDNERNLYRRKCDFSGKELISMYRPDIPFKIYQEKIWWSDKWDPMDYGQDYDFNRPFLEQLRDLFMAVPRTHTFNKNSINCDYCVLTIDSKNCYLTVSNSSEDCMYGSYFYCNDCLDCIFVSVKNESCYECVDFNHNFNLSFSQYADNCIDSSFLYSCRNCQNCFGCVNLRNKKYHIFNKPYLKEEYQKEIKKYDLGDFKNLQIIKKKFKDLKFSLPRKFAAISHSRNVTGDNISHAVNCHYCFDAVLNIENCKYAYIAGNNLKDSFDITDVGTNSELIYDSAHIGSEGGNQRVMFSYMILGSRDIQYSNYCFSSSNLFGCCSLRHKKYSILNKEYSKEEYYKMIPKIKKHMNEMPYIDKKGRVYKYGEFFPAELSPFGYNETVANDYFQLEKHEAMEQGYNWYDKMNTDYKSTIKSKDLPNHIKDVDKSITKEIIECASRDCAGSGVFQIIPKEFEFYKKKKIALPRYCFYCRHRERIRNKYSLKLYHRQCMKQGCPNEFETSYAPDRKEIVYCESCYNKEVS